MPYDIDTLSKQLKHYSNNSPLIDEKKLLSNASDPDDLTLTNFHEYVKFLHALKNALIQHRKPLGGSTLTSTILRHEQDSLYDFFCKPWHLKSALSKTIKNSFKNTIDGKIKDLKKVEQLIKYVLWLVGEETNNQFARQLDLSSTTKYLENQLEINSKIYGELLGNDAAPDVKVIPWLDNNSATTSYYKMNLDNFEKKYGIRPNVKALKKRLSSLSDLLELKINDNYENFL